MQLPLEDEAGHGRRIVPSAAVHPDVQPVPGSRPGVVLRRVGRHTSSYRTCVRFKQSAGVPSSHESFVRRICVVVDLLRRGEATVGVDLQALRVSDEHVEHATSAHADVVTAQADRDVGVA